MQVHYSIVGNGSLVQRIQHSPALQSVFNDHATNANSQEADSSRIKDLRASKHRFEVSQRPYVRSVLHYEALVGTATAVMRGRHGRKEAKAAEEWLQKQTGEMALQLAMMGGAGDETLMLIRFFDQEFVDLTKTSSSPAGLPHSSPGAIR